MQTVLLILSAAVALWVGWLLYRVMFKDGDFWECVRFTLTPDLFSLARGEYFEDVAKSFKLTAFIFAIGLSGYITHCILEWLVGLL
jgi:hypothetical protein